MVSTVAVLVGIGLVVVAVGGLFEVTNYTEQQRRDERRLMQAVTYGFLLVIALGLGAAWFGFQDASIPTWLFVGINVAVFATIVAQWRLRKAVGE